MDLPDVHQSFEILSLVKWENMDSQWYVMKKQERSLRPWFRRLERNEKYKEIIFLIQIRTLHIKIL